MISYRFFTNLIINHSIPGITPNYELVQIEGAVHEPSFRYRVSFNDKDGKFQLLMTLYFDTILM